jgi:hypothetical protein
MVAAGTPIPICARNTAEPTDFMRVLLPAIFAPVKKDEVMFRTHLQIVSHRMGYQNMIKPCGFHQRGFLFNKFRK